MTQASRVIGAVLALALFPTALLAQSAPRAICGHRADIVGRLTDHFGETARSIGMGPGNRIVEVFASDETGTWTITVTSADGTTCLVASGHTYEALMPPPPGEPL